MKKKLQCSVKVPWRHCSLLLALGFLLQLHDIRLGSDSGWNLKGLVTQPLFLAIHLVYCCRKCLAINCNSDRCLDTLKQGKRHGYDRGCLLTWLPHWSNDRGCFLTLGERGRRRMVRILFYHILARHWFRLFWGVISTIQKMVPC